MFSRQHPEKSLSALWRGYKISIIPLFLGLGACLVVVGTNVLRLDLPAWLMWSEDPAQHFTGWLYFRQSPWGFPIGANPGYGLEISSSIFYSDSIPLFAFFFKLFSPVLPNNFQYFGLWIFFCFVMQAWFAWKLIAIISDDLTIKTLATALLLFSPPMLARLYGHDSLAGHWIVLAGLYLCLSESGAQRTWKWLALAGVASLVHAYLLGMVICLWASDAIRRLTTREISFRGMICEVLVVTGGVLISLWQAGYFMVRTVSGGDFGRYGMNLNTLLNPTTGFAGDIGWSYLLPELPSGGNGFEGFNFAGLGILILMVLAVPPVLRKVHQLRLKPKWLPLVLISIGLTLFAITNNVTIGASGFILPLPERVVNAASMLRASGRMFWPVYYLLIWILIRQTCRHYRSKAAMIVLAIAFLAQAADTSAGWLPRKITDNEPAWSSILKSSEWEKIIPYYHKIRVFQPGRAGQAYKDIAYFAARHHVPTDSAYLARLDHDKYNILFQSTAQAVQTGRYERDSLYVVIDPRLVAYVQLMTNHQRDLLLNLDGLTVVAPYWYELTGNRHAVGSTGP